MIDSTLYDTLSPTEAIALQKEMRSKIDISPLPAEIRTIGGADISFNRFSDVFYAGIIILSYPSLNLIDRTTVVAKARFPYIPGLLGFRELPALLEAWNELKRKPDVLVVDGHGIAHPRRLGIAAHFGIVANTPTIGCAKSLLTGKFHEPAAERFAQSPLMDKNEQIGVVLRTKAKCKPVFISPGNKISMEQSLEIIKHCTGKYRLPEPTRNAHLLVNEIRIKAGTPPVQTGLFDAL